MSTQCISVFRMELRTNSDYLILQHLLTTLYKREVIRLLRGAS